LKTQLYEGGIRVPLIARWPARIEAGGVSDHASAFWDFMPTLAEIVGLDLPVEVDGVSMAPTLLAEERQGQHDYLYWEYLGWQAVRMGNWKAYRPAADQAIELYDLGTDIGESTDVAGEHPEIVRQIAEIMETARTESQLFPLLR
jgi:arylsulfatase A-like enzyme